MNDETDDTIEALLREQFEGPVPADDFSDQVIKRLPARQRRTEWPPLAGVLVGVATCWTSLSSAPIASIGWHDWLSGNLSASAITLLISIMGMAILALFWATAEAAERDGRLPRPLAR